jgi:hypothetical protein
MVEVVGCLPGTVVVVPAPGNMSRLKRLTCGNGTKKMATARIATVATLKRRMTMVVCEPFLEVVDGLVARDIASSGETGVAALSTTARS